MTSTLPSSPSVFTRYENSLVWCSSISALSERKMVSEPSGLFRFAAIFAPSIFSVTSLIATELAPIEISNSKYPFCCRRSSLLPIKVWFRRFEIDALNFGLGVMSSFNAEREERTVAICANGSNGIAGFLRGLVEQSRTCQGPAVQSSHGDQKEAKK